MDLFNQTGPEFLRSYLLISAGALALTFFLRKFLRPAGGESWRPDDPYEAAYVRGGTEAVVQSVLANLLHRDVVDIETGITPQLSVKRPLGENPNPFDKAAQDGATKNESLDSVTARIDSLARRTLEPRLIDAGVIVSKAQQWKITLLSNAPLWATLLLGAVRAIIGASRGRPVGFLMIEMLFVFTGAMILVAMPVGRATRSANAALDAAKEQNSGLRYASAGNGMLSNLDAKDVAYSVALFGMAPIMGTHLAVLPLAYNKNSGSSSSGGSSCGSGGSCGGGCGGGCGGCGG